MSEIETSIQIILNHYEQLAASAELLLESTDECYPSYLDLLEKSLTDLKEYKSNFELAQNNS